ncbi:MAG: hypothetical protein QXP04_03620 [Candidatus Nanoarchaeia archaeon]|nr:hypothetical protein [Candidatus Jingweiarchaeum tengchongense]
MGFEEDDSINSEIRYITIELMKIAAQRGITFEEAAREFLKNAIFFKRLIEITESTDQMSRVLLSKITLQELQNEQKRHENAARIEKEFKNKLNQKKRK